MRYGGFFVRLFVHMKTLVGETLELYLPHNHSCGGA
jgi:hypothetical protein